MQGKNNTINSTYSKVLVLNVDLAAHNIETGEDSIYLEFGVIDYLSYGDLGVVMIFVVILARLNKSKSVTTNSIWSKNEVKNTITWRCMCSLRDFEKSRKYIFDICDNKRQKQKGLITSWVTNSPLDQSDMAGDPHRLIDRTFSHVVSLSFRSAYRRVFSFHQVTGHHVLVWCYR